MKKYILIICLLFISLLSFSQKSNNYPRFFVENGDTIGIIISIEQAQKIDSDIELFTLFDKMRDNYDSTIEYYVIVTNQYEEKIASMSSKISKLEDIESRQKSMIDNLKMQIANYDSDILKANSQIVLQNQIINNQKKRIRGLKFQKAIGYISGSALLVSTIVLLVIKK